ncbi:MAG TPA: ComEC/Rec2 family competence protein, partial [Pyrinomonadaceae bacterium]|nr:ComEC/Rec2 family competence protein [Pyrinomonadaceae bacterium]
LRRLAAGAFLCLAFTFAGATLAVVDRDKHANDLGVLLDQGAVIAGAPVELTGVLTQQPEAAPEAFYLTLRVETLSWKGEEQLTAGLVSLLLPLSGKAAKNEYDKLELRYGARIRTLTTLRRSETFRNPGGTSFTEYLERKGLAATAFVKSPQLIERLDDERVLLPLAWLYDWRQQLQQAINTHFAPDTAGILNASLLGNHHFLSRSAAEKFREGGTFHVLVISGLHISFIGGLIFLIAGRVTRNKVIQFLLSATILWSYSFAVGAEASVVRAALMFTFIAFAPVMARRAASLNALGAAALVLLTMRPRDLFDPSFQLTFLSVTAIVVFAWPLLRRMSEIGSWRPTRASPYPPHCRRWLRVFCEALFWSDRKWRRELSQLNYRCKLLKTPIAERFERFHLQAIFRYGFAAMLVSCCVQITMLPLLVVYFHRVSISGLVLNIGVSAIMGVLIFSGMAALLVAPLSMSLSAPLIKVTDLWQRLMVHSVDPFAHLGFASVRLPEYSGSSAAVYVVFFVPLIILALTLPRWNPLARPNPTATSSRWRLLIKIAATAQVLLVGIVLFHPLSVANPDGKLRVDFIDVGQGDALLLTMPDGTTLLVDGGGRPGFFKKKSEGEPTESFVRDTRSIGEAVVSEYLWWRGLDQVDYVLATHADADHMSGLNDVVRNFKVRAALVARTPENDPEFLEFLVSTRNAGSPLQLIGGGDSLRFGAVRIAVLWPPASDDHQARSANNDSLVLQVEYGVRRVLLLADIESKAELSLLQQPHETLQADIVKVAHHGSRTSSTSGFVAAVHATTAIISVGQQSMFGHPHQQVVERWRAAGANVLTTGQSGTITVTTDGRELEVTTFVRE